MQYSKIKDLLTSPRILAVLMLSFSSGLPLALTGSTLQAWYTVAGVNLMTIGILTMVGQPYVFKFLWAPLMDRFAPMNIGRRRVWILIAQICLVFGLVIMAFLNPQHMPWLLASVAFVVAFFSASQDIAIDAYRTDILEVRERGVGASMTNLGYRLAMLVAGALSLILAGEIGWRYTYLIMAALIMVGILVTLKSPSPTEAQGAPRNLHDAVVEPFRDFWSRKNAMALLVFMLIYKICDAFALSLNTTFLIRGMGFSLLDVGSITKVVGLAGALLGSIVGGLWMRRLGMYRSLMVFGILQMTSNLSFVVLALVGKSYPVMSASIFLDYFCGGLSSVAIIVFLMSLCNHRYTATQYALFSAVTALGRVFIGPIAAVVVAHLGWVQFYIWSFVIGLPSLLILWWLKHRVDFTAEQWSETS
jgi:MFS transporter, PAT family, beta-lactamase induction signal transducer AmpG